MKVLVTIHHYDQTTRRFIGDIETLGMSGMQLWPSKVREITFEKITDEEARELVTTAEDSEPTNGS